MRQDDSLSLIHREFKFEGYCLLLSGRSESRDLLQGLPLANVAISCLQFVHPVNLDIAPPETQSLSRVKLLNYMWGSRSRFLLDCPVFRFGIRYSRTTHQARTQWGETTHFNFYSLWQIWVVEWLGGPGRAKTRVWVLIGRMVRFRPSPWFSLSSSCRSFRLIVALFGSVTSCYSWL